MDLWKSVVRTVQRDQRERLQPRFRGRSPLRAGRIAPSPPRYSKVLSLNPDCRTRSHKPHWHWCNLRQMCSSFPPFYSAQDSLSPSAHKRRVSTIRRVGQTTPKQGVRIVHVSSRKLDLVQSTICQKISWVRIHLISVYCSSFRVTRSIQPRVRLTIQCTGSPMQPGVQCSHSW
jgi:hypothetical protein